MKPAQVTRILALAWNDLNKQIAEMSAADLKQLLNAELDKPHRDRRPYVVSRLTQRYCAQHNAEVKEEIRQKYGV
jgi:hypothetical protein